MSAEDYIAKFPADVQKILAKVRATIRKAAPDAEETIKYGIPTFTMGGRNLVHFAGYAKHVGFYPTPAGLTKFKKELAGYESSKGAVRFPLDAPVPYDVIRDITRFRVSEMAGEKIMTLHPQGKSGRSIDKAKYDRMAKAIRSILGKGEVTHGELMDRVNAALEGRFDGNVSWYAGNGQARPRGPRGDRADGVEAAAVPAAPLIFSTRPMSFAAPCGL